MNIVSGHRIDHIFFVGRVCHVQSVYDITLLEYTNSIRDPFSTIMHPHKWWSTLKIFIFVVNSSDDGSITYNPSIMAEVFFLYKYVFD